MEKKYDPNQVYEIPLKEIFADDEFNSRGVIDPTSLIELAKSIATRGLDQPITIQPWSISSRPEIKFRIVAGYRRYKAHIMNKAATVRSLIKEGLTDLDARILNLTENLHRQDLTPKMEAYAIRHLHDLGMTQDAVAKRIGKSRGWVQERFYLLQMPEVIQNEVDAGLLKLSDVRRAVNLESPEEMIEFMKQVKEARYKKKVREIDPNKVIKQNVKKIRTREEMFDMQDIIVDLFGFNLATRALAWASGEISDLEMHRSIAEEAGKKGRYYEIPPELIGKHAVTMN